jgi:group I intron endonuclease
MRGIYSITNTITDTVYFGQSVNMEKRIKTHIRNLKNNNHDNDHLQKAWNKHGENAFVFKPIEIVEEIIIDLTPIETKYYYSTENRYNIAPPDKAISHSLETRRKISEGNKGKIIPYNVRQKISISHTGKAHPHRSHSWSEAAKKKLSLTKTGITRQKFSKETIKSMSESHKGKKHSKETREKMSISTKRNWDIKRGLA